MFRCLNVEPWNALKSTSSRCFKLTVFAAVIPAVMNFHSDGAMLHSLTHHIAAFKFDLSLDGFKTTKHCRVVWRNGNTCGVKFVDRRSNARAANGAA